LFVNEEVHVVIGYNNLTEFRMTNFGCM